MRMISRSKTKLLLQDFYHFNLANPETRLILKRLLITLGVKGQYSISKPFPFFILITILIQATQADRSTWLLCAGWLVMKTKMSMVMIM